MSDKYILVDGAVVAEPDLLKWTRWLANAERVVANTDVGEASVSTVFLGLDHNISRRGPPVLWETMIFGGRHDGRQQRYTSRAAAEAGHLDAVALAKGAG